LQRIGRPLGRPARLVMRDGPLGREQPLPDH
jgi:hypothetical protein